MATSGAYSNTVSSAVIPASSGISRSVGTASVPLTGVPASRGWIRSAVDIGGGTAALTIDGTAPTTSNGFQFSGYTTISNFFVQNLQLVRVAGSAATSVSVVVWEAL